MDTSGERVLGGDDGGDRRGRRHGKRVEVVLESRLNLRGSLSEKQRVLTRDLPVSLGRCTTRSASYLFPESAPYLGSNVVSYTSDSCPTPGFPSHPVSRDGVPSTLSFHVGSGVRVESKTS